jgi:hypothetical protein
MDLNEIECLVVTQNRDQLWAIVNTVMNIMLPQNSGQFHDELNKY